MAFGYELSLPYIT